MGTEITSPGLLTVAVDGVTITGDGTPGNPLVSSGGGIDLQVQGLAGPPPGSDYYFNDIVFTTDGLFGYVGNQNSDGRPVWKFSTATLAWVGFIACGNGPSQLAITPDGSKIYASNFFSGSVSVISTATDTVVATVPGFTQPVGLDVTPDGSTVYVADYLGSNVRRIDTATDTIVGPAIVLTGPLRVSVNPAGTKVYVSESDVTNAMQIISTATNLVVGTILVAAPLNAPGDIVFKTGGGQFFVRDGGFGQLRRVDTSTDTLTGPAIALGGQPLQDLGINAAKTKVYAPLTNGNVVVVDTTTNLVLTTIVGVGVTNGLQGIGAQGNFVYVCQYGFFGPANIFVIDTTLDAVVGTVNGVASPPPTDLGQFTTIVLSGGGQTLTDLGGGVASLDIPEDSFVFVWQPNGGGAGPVVFDVFDDLYTALLDVGPGPKTIMFDDSMGNLNFPAAEYDMTDVLWRGVGGGQGSFVDVPTVNFDGDATNILNLRHVQRLRLYMDSAVPPIKDMNDGAVFILDDHARIDSDSPIIGFDNVAEFKWVIIDVRNGSQIRQSAFGGVVVLNNPNTIAVFVNADKSSLVEANTFGPGTTSPTNSALTFFMEGTSYFSGFPALQSYWADATPLMTTAPSAYNLSANDTSERPPGHLTYFNTGVANDVFLTPASWTPGGWTIIKNTSTETKPLSIRPSGADTIDGKLVYVIATAGASIRLVSDGLDPGNWMVSASHHDPGSYVFMEGETPGGGVGQSVELTINTDPLYFTLADDTNYTLLVTAIAHGVSPGTTNQSFRQMFSVRKALGLTVIAAAGALEQIGDAGGSTWTLVASVGAGPDRFALTFTDGTSNTYTRTRAKIEIVEVYVPPM